MNINMSKQIAFFVSQISEHLNVEEHSVLMHNAPNTNDMSELHKYWADQAKKNIGPEEYEDICKI